MSDSGRVLGDCSHGHTRGWCVTCLREEVTELRAFKHEALTLRKALATIAGYRPGGPQELDAMDEPCSARIARDAIHESLLTPDATKGPHA